MTFTETTNPSQTHALSFELNLPHPPEKVWRALTEPKLVSQWLLSVDELPVREGATFTLTAPPQPGWDGIVECCYLKIERPRRLSWRWTVGEIDTVVTVTLQPTADGTRVSLVQSGFRPDQKQNFDGARYGWSMMTEKLTTVLGGLP